MKLLQGDCLELMTSIPDSSVDAVITDPPYGIDFQSAWRIEAERMPKIANDKAPFIWWLYGAARVLKISGVLICFCRWDTQEAFKSAIEWAGLSVKSQVIWDREVHGMGDLKGSFAPQHDVIWFAVKGKGFSFPRKRPKSILRHQRVNGCSLVHPNEKPVDLMLDIVKSVTNVGDVVLEPFMGSGSTGVACVNTGRNFIGIEKDPSYFEIAKKRIEEAQKIPQQLNIEAV